MKQHQLVFLAVLFLSLYSCQNKNKEKESIRLWYESPALASVPDESFTTDDDPEWLKALPLGNGSLGAMVFGDVNQERIQLSEESMWSGSEDDNDNPEAKKWLPKFVSCCLKGNTKKPMS